jgi:hypothetical protein
MCLVACERQGEGIWIGSAPGLVRQQSVVGKMEAEYLVNRRHIQRLDVNPIDDVSCDAKRVTGHQRMVMREDQSTMS